MKVNLWASYSDGMDGSYSIHLHNTKQEALDRLERTEEELEQGNLYDDGAINEIELDIDEKTGKLNKEVYISVG